MLLSSSLVHHPNIVRFYGIFTENDIPYIVTEFMNRGSLLDLLQISKFSQQDRRDMHVVEVISSDAFTGLLEQPKEWNIFTRFH